MKKEILTFLKIYAITWLIIIIWFIIRSFTEEISLIESFSQLLELLTYKQFVIGIQILFGILYVLFLLVRYFIRSYKKFGFVVMLKRLVFRLIIPVFLVVFSIKYIFNTNTTDNYVYQWDHEVENTSEKATSYYNIDRKHRGMSVFGRLNESSLKDLTKNNIEWVAVIPFIDQKDEQSLDMSKPKEIGKWRRRDSIFIKNISQLHEKGINVMLKPHLWLSSGWRSNLKFESKTHWDTWFATYRNNILHYAQLAQISNVKMLCIGTELKTSTKEQPEKWKLLIQEIKAIYHGELTYAANWDSNFDEISFWGDLDYIGIQAYFPLTQSKSPSLKDIKLGWQSHISQLEALSKKYNKPILFTEIGYRSDVTNTVKPWEWNSLKNLAVNRKSDHAQQLAYEAMFESLWHKKWFKGSYIWQWNTRTSEENAKKSMDFSPRFKPAQNTIAKWYNTIVLLDSLTIKAAY